MALRPRPRISPPVFLSTSRHHSTRLRARNRLPTTRLPPIRPRTRRRPTKHPLKRLATRTVMHRSSTARLASHRRRVSTKVANTATRAVLPSTHNMASMGRSQVHHQGSRLRISSTDKGLRLATIMGRHHSSTEDTGTHSRRHMVANREDTPSTQPSSLTTKDLPYQMAHTLDMEATRSIRDRPFRPDGHNLGKKMCANFGCSIWESRVTDKSVRRGLSCGKDASERRGPALKLSTSWLSLRLTFTVQTWKSRAHKLLKQANSS